MLNHVITQAEQNLNQSIQSDRLLYCHSERALATEESHNIFCSTLEGEPKSMISMGGKMSPCCGLLRHFVTEISPSGINVPHNDMEICSLAPSDSAEQNNPVNCFARGGLGRGGKKKAAFTLAEVLITLGIIGIVAAMTIPTLISKNQKRVIEAKLKEDYSIIQQVIKSNEGDDVDMSMLLKDEDTNSQKQWFETYFAPYMKYSHVCYNEAGCWQNRGKNRTLDSSIAHNDRQNIGIGLDVVTVKLNNGTNICMDVWGAYSLWNRFGINTSNPGLTFYIDSNGDSGPNVIGKDIYVLTYTSENGILPAGYHKTAEEINNNCSEKATGTTAGTFCLLRAKNNGWIIPDDVWKLK